LNTAHAARSRASSRFRGFIVLPVIGVAIAGFFSGQASFIMEPVLSATSLSRS